MKTSRQFLLWFVLAVTFCAVLSVGCGSSSSNDSSTQDEEANGRN